MRRLFALILAAALVFAGMLPALASGERDGSVQPAVTNNRNHWDYWDWQNWSQPVRSHLYANGDGTFTRVEYTGTEIVAEVYDANLVCTSSREIPMELTLYGGFFAGSEYNYLVFGQENPNEDDTVEVIRTVKYSKSWERLGSVGLYGANTIVPFDGGSLRMDESGDLLFVRTCHKMYATSDGLNHQASLTYIVDTATMTITSSQYAVANVGAGYLSHSFNQFIKVDGDRLVILDQCDALVRGAVLLRYDEAVGPTTVSSLCNGVAVVGYVGGYGDNYTYATIGGLESSSVGSMTVGTVNRVSSDTAAPRNVYVSVTSRETFNAANTTVTKLTDYGEGDRVTIGNPQLVKINNDKFLVLWRENRTVKMAFVNGSAQLISEVVSTPYLALSDCMPIVVGNTVLWYVTKNTAPEFCKVDVSGSTPVPLMQEDPAVTALNEALNVTGGTIEFTTLASSPFYAIQDGERYAARSSEIEDQTNSELYADVVLNAGDRLMFDYRTSANGYLYFIVNGSSSYQYCSEPGWKRYEYTATASGPVSFTWRYNKTFGYCLIDDVRIVRAGETEPAPLPDLLDQALNIDGGSIDFRTDFNYTFGTGYDGERFAAKAEKTEGSTQTYAKIYSTIELNEGDMLAFEFRITPYSNSGGLAFSDGTSNVSVSSANNIWQLYVYTAASTKSYSFTWSYYNQNTVGNCCMIDNVRVIPAGNPAPEPLPDPVADALNAALNVEGGTIKFTSAGQYAFTAGEMDGRLVGMVSDVPNGQTIRLSMTVELEEGDAIVFEHRISGANMWIRIGSGGYNNVYKDSDIWCPNMLPVTQSGTFTVEWYCQSKSDSMLICIDNVRIVRGGAALLNSALNAEGGTLSIQAAANPGISFPYSVVNADGRCYARMSGFPTDYYSILTLTVELAAGDKITFDYKAENASLFFNDGNQWQYCSSNGGAWTTYEYTAQSAGTVTLKWQTQAAADNPSCCLDNIALIKADGPAVQFVEAGTRDRTETDSYTGLRMVFRVTMNNCKVHYGTPGNYNWYNGTDNDDIPAVTGICVRVTRVDNGASNLIPIRNIYAMNAYANAHTDGASFDFTVVIYNVDGARGNWRFTAEAHVTYGDGALASASTDSPVSYNGVLNNQ